MDCLRANVHKLGSQALPYALIAWTWQQTLKDEGTLPPNWIVERDTKVLVGIEPISRLPALHRSQTSTSSNTPSDSEEDDHG